MFPKGYFSSYYFADVYWEPIFGGGPPVTSDLWVMWIHGDEC